MKLLKFEERLIEFVNMKNDEKFIETGLAFFSSGARMGGWFYVNKDRIFSLNNDISKQIEKEYNDFVVRRKYELEQKKERSRLEIEKFQKNCELFYNIEGYDKYKEDSGVKLNGELLAYDWFKYYYNRIMKSTLNVCKLIKLEYRKYKIKEKKDKVINERKKVYEFFYEKK